MVEYGPVLYAANKAAQMVAIKSLDNNGYETTLERVAAKNQLLKWEVEAMLDDVLAEQAVSRQRRELARWRE